jgi:hypothetical protein
MKREYALIAVVISGLFVWAVVVGLTYVQASGSRGEGGAQASPMGTGFTYQGQLEGGNGPVSDDCDMVFHLYDQAADGSQVGEALTMTVPITGGLFTVNLDFGSGVFLGEARWLGIQVRCPGDLVYTNLGRQELTAAPYALYASRAYDADMLDGQEGSSYHDWNNLTHVPDGFADGIDDDTTYSAGNQLTISGGQYHVQEGSGSDLDADMLDGHDASDFWKVGGNAGTTAGTDFLGTTDSQPLVIKTNGTEAVRITNAGNVGIGTTSPSVMLDVSGTARAGDFECSGCIDAGDIDASQVQKRIGATCPNGSAIRAVGSEGTVTCESDDTGLVDCSECDTRFVNEGQPDSITSGMVGFNYAASSSEGGPANNLSCSSCVGSGEVSFNYAGSSSKGGMALDSDRIDGLDILRFNGRSSFTVVEGAQLRISIDSSKNVLFENKGSSNSHYWYSVNNAAPTAAYQAAGTTHNAGSIPWNSRMEFFYIVTQTGPGNQEFYWGIIFNDGVNSANNWHRGFVLKGP